MSFPQCVTPHDRAGAMIRLAIMTAALAAASPQKVIDEVTGDEHFVASIPSDFKVGYTASAGDHTITELVPVKETVNDWTTIITVQVFPDRKDAIATGWMTRFVERTIAACPRATKGAYIPMGDAGSAIIPVINGYRNGFRTALSGVHCPSSGVTGKVEDQTNVALQGAHTLYLVTYAFARDPVAHDEEDRLRYLRSLVLCDRKDLAHPC